MTSKRPPFTVVRYDRDLDALVVEDESGAVQSMLTRALSERVRSHSVAAHSTLWTCWWLSVLDPLGWHQES